MSKQLLLIRHAEAESEGREVNDFDRLLTSKGIMDAYKMGRKLHESGFVPDVMISSPAVRTLTTARFIAGQLSFDENRIQTAEQLYNASPRVLLETINRLPDTAQCAILINHNPGITYIAEYLSGSNIGHMSPCSIACIVFDTDHWALISQRSGQLTAFLDPPRES